MGTGSSLFGKNSLIILCTLMQMTLPAMIEHHIDIVWLANIMGLILAKAIECLVIAFVKRYVTFFSCIKIVDGEKK